MIYIILAAVLVVAGIALAVSFRHSWDAQMRRARGVLVQDEWYHDELCK